MDQILNPGSRRRFRRDSTPEGGPDTSTSVISRTSTSSAASEGSNQQQELGARAKVMRQQTRTKMSRSRASVDCSPILTQPKLKAKESGDRNN